MSQVILKAENINKYFGATHAVADLNLELFSGEIHGLIGENGSGKSTFSSMLCGIHTISSGTLTLLGKEIKPRSQVEANKLGISIIVQEIGTLPGLTVAENLFLIKSQGNLSLLRHLFKIICNLQRIVYPVEEACHIHY